MATALEWKELAPQLPYIDGQLIVDSISRDNYNNVTFSVNLKAHVRMATGYWNYAWFVNMQCGNIVWNDCKLKNRVNGGGVVIGGADYWFSTFNGNFKGTIKVNTFASSIPIKVTFHDDVGNWGATQTWNVSIPAPTNVSGVRASVSNITPNTATVTATVQDMGAYAVPQSWVLRYGKYSTNENTKTITSNVGKTYNFNLTGLEAGTNYQYRVTFTNSAGLANSSPTQFFTTEDDVIGYLVESGRTRALTGWIIYPDGQRKKISKVRRR